MLDQLPHFGPGPTFLILLLPLLALSVAVGFALHYAYKVVAKKQGNVSKDIHKKAEETIHQIVPSTIWLPIYVKVTESPEIVIRWNSHFLLISTAALSELSNEELTFLVKSERRHLKLFQKKYLPVIMALIFIPIYSLMFISVSARNSLPPFFVPIASWIIAGTVIPIAHLARQHSDKWRKLADEQTVAEMPHPQVAATAVQKSIRSAIPESKQTPYQLSMKRLEAVENAIRLRERLSNNRFL